MQFLQNSLMVKVLKSKLFVWCTLPVVVSGIIILAYFSGIKDFPVFPNQQVFDYRTYSDSTAGGDSKIIRKVVSDSIIEFEFKISDKISNPYVGLNIGPKQPPAINLKKYNQLKLTVSGREIDGISIALVTENTFKTSDKRKLDVLFYHVFKIATGTNTYTISLDKFKMPDWWSETNRIENAAAIKPDLKSLKALNVSSAYTPDIDKILSFEIYAIEFSRNNKQLFVLVTALVLLFVLIVFVALYSVEKIKLNRKVITIAYKPVENKSIENAKSDFIGFINNNFQNSELTLDFVSGETGVSQRKITTEVQNRFGCNFKTYINRLRLNESKRLLQNKDLNIGEIAFKVGFNNQSHFNRVFKAEFQISPTEYREKIRE